MNTKIVAAVAAGVILLGVAGYLVLGKNQTKETTPTPTQTSQKPSDIWQLLSSGVSQKCDFSYTSDDSRSKGTFYFTGKKMRGDITTTTKGKNSVFYLISDGDVNYLWGTGLEGGFKMTLKEADLKTSSQFAQYFDANKKTDYKCSAWVTDNSKFTPPTNIKFMDFSSYTMPNSGTKTPTSGATQYGTNCSACNYLSGDQKMACLAQLNCPQ